MNELIVGARVHLVCIASNEPLLRKAARFVAKRFARLAIER